MKNLLTYNALEQQLQLRPMFAPASMMLVGAVVTLGRKSIKIACKLQAFKAIKSHFGILLARLEIDRPVEENAVVPKQLIEWPPHDSPPS